MYWDVYFPGVCLDVSLIRSFAKLRLDTRFLESAAADCITIYKD